MGTRPRTGSTHYAKPATSGLDFGFGQRYRGGLVAARRFVPITLKVNLLIIAGMVIGIGSISFALASTLFVTIDEVSMQNMAGQADAIYAAIESLMLPGEALLAQGFFQRLNAIDAGRQVHLYR